MLRTDGIGWGQFSQVPARCGWVPEQLLGMNEIPTVSEIETPRRPSELRSFVNEARSRMTADETTMKSVRLFKGQTKYLLTEVVPVAQFAVWRWPLDDVKFPPFLGQVVKIES